MAEFVANTVALIRVRMILNTMILSDAKVSDFPVPNGWNSLIVDHAAQTRYGGEFKLAHDCVTWICKQKAYTTLIDFNE